MFNMLTRHIKAPWTVDTCVKETGSLQTVDWTTGMDYWNGLLD